MGLFSYFDSDILKLFLIFFLNDFFLDHMSVQQIYLFYGRVQNLVNKLQELLECFTFSKTALAEILKWRLCRGPSELRFGIFGKQIWFLPRHHFHKNLRTLYYYWIGFWHDPKNRRNRKNRNYYKILFYMKDLKYYGTRVVGISSIEGAWRSSINTFRDR